jgi:hypothetical protein
MGWSRGIVEGKTVGYSVNARCEHPGCKAGITRGLANKCGAEPGSGVGFCNGYFCSEHLGYLGINYRQVCQSCANDVARMLHRKLPFPQRKDECRK